MTKWHNFCLAFFKSGQKKPHVPGWLCSMLCSVEVFVKLILKYFLLPGEEKNHSRSSLTALSPWHPHDARMWQRPSLHGEKAQGHPVFVNERLHCLRPVSSFTCTRTKQPRIYITMWIFFFLFLFRGFSKNNNNNCFHLRYTTGKWNKSSKITTAKTQETTSWWGG